MEVLPARSENVRAISWLSARKATRVLQLPSTCSAPSSPKFCRRSEKVCAPSTIRKPPPRPLLSRLTAPREATLLPFEMDDPLRFRAGPLKPTAQI